MEAETQVAGIMARLRSEMNGAVSRSMRELGVEYPVNYGVSVSVIRKIASGYAPDHGFAKLLWEQRVRELKLAALVIADPTAVDTVEAGFWAEGITNTELAEHAATVLFGRSSAPGRIFDALIGSDNILLVYAALLTAAKGISCVAIDEVFASAIPDKVFGVLDSGQCSAGFVLNGAAALLNRVVIAFPSFGMDIREKLDIAASRRASYAEYISGEIFFE